MNILLILAYLFLIGSVSGWVLELFFRRFFSSSNPQRKWINPGFCTGPYLPIYGCGLCLLFLIASLEEYSFIASPFWNKAILFLIMAAVMTAVEYAAGYICLKVSNVRLWDYSGEWGNIKGLICPKFSAVWAALGAVYYFLIHPYIINALVWLSKNLAFSFFIGLFFGFFIVDVINSAQIVAKLRRFAEENEVVLRYESIKADIRRRYDENRQKYRFFRPFGSDRPLNEHLKEMRDSFEKKIKKPRRK